MELINLTPHEVRLMSESGDLIVAIPASGRIARVSETRVASRTLIIDEENSCCSRVIAYGGVVDLLDPEDGRLYIVSRVVAAACSERNDLVFPGGETRDNNGRINGCTRLDSFG